MPALDTEPDPATPWEYPVAFFNPASNRSARSYLRLVNRNDTSASVTLSALDALAYEGASEITLEIAPQSAVNLSAAALEEGDEAFLGAFGDGAGKWRLHVRSDAALKAPLLAMRAARTVGGNSMTRLTIVGVLAALALVAGAGGAHATQAQVLEMDAWHDTAIATYPTGEAGGRWTKESVCEIDSQTREKRCWTTTAGLSESGAYIADLGYTCADTGRTMIGVSFTAADGAAAAGEGIIILAARLDGTKTLALFASVHTAPSEHSANETVYLYSITAAAAERFVAAVSAHRSLEVLLPYTDAESQWARFTLRGAIEAIKATRRVCAAGHDAGERSDATP